MHIFPFRTAPPELSHVSSRISILASGCFYIVSTRASKDSIFLPRNLGTITLLTSLTLTGSSVNSSMILSSTVYAADCYHIR